MCCYHRPMKARSVKGRRGVRLSLRLGLRDDRGVAAVEGVLVVALLAGVLLGCMLLGQWGTHRQYAQMGARLLAFNAGNDSLAKFGRQADQATQTPSTGTWDTLVTGVPTNWLNMMFVNLDNDRLSGDRKGTQQGRLPSQGPSMFDFSPASLGYSSGASAATNSWADSAANVELTFLGIAYWVGYHESTPEGLTTKPEITASGLPILDTIYARVGVPLNP